MEKITFDEIVEAVEGKVVLGGQDRNYTKVSTDTRTLEPGDIFVALRGEIFNGNEYVKLACEKGAALCIVDQLIGDIEKLPKESNIILVQDTRKALLDLAKYYRKKLSIHVIGITGSTGKTSTKDLVAAALSGKYKVFKTKGNFNNEIGLPLMIFQLDASYEVAVLEMGMSNLGEIHRLAEVARPDIGIITNIGLSHIENLHTRENILKAKLEITDFFDENHTLIINEENDLLATLSSNTYELIKIGTKKGLNFTADGIIIEEESIQFNIEENGIPSEEKFHLPIPGKHNVLNTLLAIACGRKLGLTYEELRKGLKNLEATSMRLDIIKGKDFTIINDCYNASPDSMEAALEVLATFKGQRKIAILGTMKELGKEAYEAHRKVGAYAKKKQIDLLAVIGEFEGAFQEGFEGEGQFMAFSTQEELLQFILPHLQREDVILIKASRSMKFETMVKELEKYVNTLEKINS